MKKRFSLLLALLIALLALSASAETYTATVKGFGGDVTVEITINGTDITDAKITGDNETPGVGSLAVEQMPEQIENADTYDVDGVAGATITSTAVRDAVKEILTAIGFTAEEDGTFAPGTYSATFHGFTSDVTLELTLTEDAIADAKILEQAETNGIGSVHQETLNKFLAYNDMAPLEFDFEAYPLSGFKADTEFDRVLNGEYLNHTWYLNNEAGVPMVGLSITEGLVHSLYPEFAKIMWSYAKHFSRNTETGEVIYNAED